MGTWHLEIVRMAAYIAFPVGMFHWFNQPENFREYVEKLRFEDGSEDDPELRQKFNTFAEEYNKKKDLENLKAMEEKYLK